MAKRSVKNQRHFKKQITQITLGTKLEKRKSKIAVQVLPIAAGAGSIKGGGGNNLF